MEEASTYQKTTSSHKWYGKKTTTTQTSHTVTNKVTEFNAGGDINLLSRDDSTYEASKISTAKNATLTSTQGKINFKAVKNSTFEQTVTTSKGFYITQSNRGYTAERWVLPTVYTGGQLTVDAAKGISADVKSKNALMLQNAVSALGNDASTAWLKNLDTRSDVQWAAVSDAYNSWDYKTQQLNPAVAAVIAIAAAAVTAGSSLVASAAGSIATTAGGGTMGAMAGGAFSAGMASLASQAAVALAENKGNLSKTLKAMGTNEAVKSTATSMVIGGALAGFDTVLDIKVDPKNARLPLLIKDQGWTAIAQRVAGQSVISSTLNTSINGGSFKDNFTLTLLSNIGSQVNAEGANLIGDNGKILGLPGKVLSHAVVAGVAAEISGGNVKGAAAGAMAAELAAVTLGSIFVAPEMRDIQITSTGRVIGALVGAALTGKASGANSGASAAESVLQFNFLLHEEPKTFAEKYIACKTDSKCQGKVMAEMSQTSAKHVAELEDCRAAGNSSCVNSIIGDLSNTTGFDTLGDAVGYDVSGYYQDLAKDALQQVTICGSDTGTSCLFKIWKETIPREIGTGLALGGIGKLFSVAAKGYFYALESVLYDSSGLPVGWTSTLARENELLEINAFKTEVANLRAGLSSRNQTKGNIAVASIDIDGVSGMPKTMASYSKVNVQNESFVGAESENYDYLTTILDNGGKYTRNVGTEYKILDNITDILGENRSVKGVVTIFTENIACKSCLGVVSQFQERYTGIAVKIIDNSNVLLSPKAIKK